MFPTLFLVYPDVVVHYAAPSVIDGVLDATYCHGTAKLAVARGHSWSSMTKGGGGGAFSSHARYMYPQ